MSVTVTPVNDAPTAQDFAGTVAEDSTNIAVDLTTLTDDIDGDALTYTITTPGQRHPDPQRHPRQLHLHPERELHRPRLASPTPSPTAPADRHRHRDRSPSRRSTTPRSPSTTSSRPTKTSPLSFPATDLSANDTDVDGTTPTVTAVSNPTGGTVALAGGDDHLHPDRELHRHRRLRLHPLRRHPDRHRPRHRHHHRGQRRPGRRR